MPEINRILPPLPVFVAKKPLYISKNFQVVMDYKPFTHGTIADQRFFIEPLTDEAERMLEFAAKRHNIKQYQFNERVILEEERKTKRRCIRADFIQENLPALLWGQIDIPDGDKDSMPSPRRMEECLTEHPQKYTFQD